MAAGGTLDDMTPRAAESASLAVVMRRTAGLLPALRADFTIALLAVTIGTNLLDFATVPAKGARPGAAFAAVAAIRVVLVFWIGYAVQRRLAGAANAVRPGTALARFVVLQLIFAAGMIAVRAVVLRVLGHGDSLAGEWLVNFVGLALWSLIAIRLLAWNAALAAGERFAALPPLWREQRGTSLAVAGAFAALVLPIAGLHLALTLVAVRLSLGIAAYAGIAIADGVVSAGQLVMMSALAAVAWRLATEAENEKP